ncbi:hypothetical protein L1987_65014 [Smallanthus sonchifolius]|uniref:Uncharacterized protein n=1 Tax=Smallanthus sonchifolius TaxID=185202 RepID=A0ACB9BT73_9ASTR|nr:hypothetical protein L1987_65014 [Smallanthus sonchifolius]
MSISLADHSVKYPRGIVENLLVKVGKYVFPVDFIILDMDADDRVPLILGHLFLRTAKTLIDVFDGKLTLHVGDSNPVIEVGEPSLNFEEPFDRVLELEKLLDELDEYNDEVPDDLLEMMAELDEIIGKTPSMGKLVESVEDHDDPGEGLEVTPIANPISEPLPITVVHSEGG